MRKIAPFIIIFGLFLYNSCVQFKTQTLYDGLQPLPKQSQPENIVSIVEPIIYQDDDSNLWGIQKDVCQNVSLSKDITHTGNQAIKLQWNRNAKGCKWAGIGIGWDDWVGKDLTPLMDYAAIQMFVRTIEGKSFNLPIVMTLIDYSKGMGFSYTHNKFFERTTIDENWQKVIVPLNSFDIKKEKLDPSNIQQLQMELQQSGNFYIDDISLIFYQEQKQTPWLVEEITPNPLNVPIQIFDESFINNNGWGLITDHCQSFLLSNNDSSKGKNSLHLTWNKINKSCSLTSIGASWNKWHPIDLSSAKNNLAIQLDIKIKKNATTTLPIAIGFEDYNRTKAFVDIQSHHTTNGQFNQNWQTITIPISEIQTPIDWANIKQFYLDFKDKGEVLIDNIKLVDPNI